MNTQRHATDGLVGPDDQLIEPWHHPHFDRSSGLVVSEGGYTLNTRRPLHCTGPCDQGRKSCPCPADCERPEEDERHVSGALAWPVKTVLAVLLVLACWHIAVRLAA